MSLTDELLAHNAAYAARFPAQDGRLSGRSRLVIVTCMDVRMDAWEMFGLEKGQANVLRNAGGVVTDDVVRSICVSQRKLGSTEIMLVHHTGCGMQTITDDGFRAELCADTGVEPTWSAGSFTDAEDDVRQSIARLRADPFVQHEDAIRGFVYVVTDGSLREVTVRPGG